MIDRHPDRRAVVLLGSLRAAMATSVLFLIGFVLPFGGPLLMLLTPQPALRLYQRAGWGPLLAAVALAATAIGLAGGLSAVAVYALTFALLTVLLPVLLGRAWSLEATVAVATAAVGAALAAGALIAASPAEVLAAVRGSLEDVRRQAMAVYGRAGLAAEVLRDLEEGSRGVIDLLLRLSPSLFLLSISVTVLLNLDLLRREQRTRGLVPVFGDLTRWKCPPELVWPLIASGYATLLLDGLPRLAALNAFTVLLAVYFCQGLVIAQFYMRRWRSPLWVNGLVYLFILVEWLLATGVMLLGVFDLWADFRRLNPRPAGDD
ncbi:MAG: DUF2232 domain-containing protein [Deltaproteobacteria bacterium]|nr:DUF2232 domain-containing protein [Deltaproteobacteria bacterium]